MSRLVSGALLLGGAVVALLAPTYNGQWLWGIIAMAVGGVGLYITAEDPEDDDSCEVCGAPKREGFGRYCGPGCHHVSGR